MKITLEICKKRRYISIYDLYNILLGLRLGKNCRTQKNFTVDIYKYI